LKLLIYEYITGGGYAGKEISPSILSEGFGMLRALISDFKAAGHFVTTFLDSRLTAFSSLVDADEIITPSPKEELEKTLTSLSESADATYIIAPESAQTLQRLVECIEKAGGVSLNCSATAIEKISNKHTLYDELKRIGIRTPDTLMVDSCEDIKEIKHSVSELGFPLIFKPIDGVGCQGLSIVRNEKQIKSALDKLMKESLGRYFLAQKFVKGTASSVSLISTEEEALPLTLNEQIVTLSPPSSDSAYTGGIVPLHHPLLEDALETAQRIVELFKGLRGYIGVDMSGGYAFFSKVKVPTSLSKFHHKICKLKEIVSPPFSSIGENNAYALLIAHSTKLKSAKTKLYETTKCLINMASES